MMLFALIIAVIGLASGSQLNLDRMDWSFQNKLHAYASQSLPSQGFSAFSESENKDAKPSYDALCDELSQRNDQFNEIRLSHVHNPQDKMLQKQYLESQVDGERNEQMSDELGCKQGRLVSYRFHKHNQKNCEEIRDLLDEVYNADTAFTFHNNWCDKNPFISAIDRELIKKARR